MAPQRALQTNPQPDTDAASTSSAPGAPPEPAIRTVVALLFANLALSAVFAALTLLFRHNVLDYQLGQHPGAGDPQELRRQLSLTLWTRPVPILAVSVLYVWVVRQLRGGSRRAYLRVRVIPLVGLAAVGYLMVSAQYPEWLRAVQGLQLLLLGALVVAVNRRAVRAAFARGPAPTARPGNRRAALALVVLTPVVAELTLGTTPLAMAWLIVLWLPIYGAGVLLIRELVRRTGGGWAGLLLLGVAYGVVEEGLALQSLTSPSLYHAATWAPRVLGINTAYTELNLIYHPVFSVAIPIALVELLFSRHGHAPYLRRGGLIGTGLVALLGVGLLRVSVPPNADPGYVAPPAALLGFTTLVAVLAIIALWVLPRRAGRRHPTGQATLRRPPRPAVVGMLCGAGALGFLGLLFPFGGASQPAFTHGLWVLAPMLAAAALAVGVGLVLRRWSAAPCWTRRHRLVAITGALVAHTAFGVAAKAHTTLDVAGLTAIGVVLVVLLAVLDRRLAAGPNVRNEPLERTI